MLFIIGIKATKKKNRMFNSQQFSLRRIKIDVENYSIINKILENIYKKIL